VTPASTTDAGGISKSVTSRPSPSASISTLSRSCKLLSRARGPVHYLFLTKSAHHKRRMTRVRKDEGQDKGCADDVAPHIDTARDAIGSVERPRQDRRDESRVDPWRKFSSDICPIRRDASLAPRRAPSIRSDARRLWRRDLVRGLPRRPTLR